MKKRIIIIICIVLGISSCGIQQQYTCPAVYQVPSNMKSIPSKYESLEVSKRNKKFRKLQQTTSKKSQKRRKGKYSYKKGSLVICLSSFFLFSIVS